MAAAALATIPVLLVFLIFQRQIIKGIVLTGLK
jgi:multiple sugar transport system permease protein